MVKQPKPSTKSKRSRTAPADLSELSRALIHSTGAGIYIAQKGKLVYFSPLAEEFSGYSNEEIRGVRCLDLVYPDDRETVRNKAIENLKHPSNSNPYEYRFVRKCGTATWVIERVTSIEYRGGRAVMGSFMDITEKKRMEEALAQSEEKYRTMLEQIQDSYYEVDLAGNFAFANKATCEVLGYPRRELIGLNFSVVTDPCFLTQVFSAFHKVYKTGKPNKAFANRIIRKDGSIRYAESSISLRLNEKQEAIGFSCVGRDVTERKELEEALSRSEERFRTMLERMQDSYYEIDLAGNYTYVNEAVVGHLGFSREELIGKSYRISTPEDEHKNAFRAFNEVYRTGVPNRGFSHRIRSKDGSVRLVESSIDLRKNERGEVIGFRSVSRDVTERKKLEEDLRRSEERFRTIIERMQDAYYEMDLRGNYTFANYAVANSLGYSREEMACKNYRDLIPEEEISDVFRAYNEVYKTGVPNKGITHKSIRKDGSVIFLESTIDLLRNDAGEAVGFRTVSRDITARKLLEDNLRQSEERYRAILEEMEDAYYEVDLAGNFTFMNEQTCRDTGYTRDELTGMSYRRVTFKDDFDTVYGVFNRTIKTGQPNKGFAHRMIRKDGSMRFVEAAISLLKNKAGDAIGFRCVSRDVTERKLLEEELADSEERYRTILEQMQDSYYEVDMEGNFLFANDATCRGLEMPLEKLIGTDYHHLIPDEERPSVFDAFNQVLKTGIPNPAFAHRVITPGSTIGYAEVSISLLKDKKGKTIGFRCVSRDVTERKQMEQLLADMATHDFLTELPNRVLLIDRFEIALAQAQRKNHKLAVMSLDLDRFKEVNDTMGHTVGDQVLKQVAVRLVAMVRSSDTVARLGGDEFLLLLQEIGDLQDATTIAEKIVSSFKEPFSIDGRYLQLSASIGIAIYPDDGDELETLMKKSDASMYYSKRRGGSQYRVHCTSDRQELS